MIKFLLLSTVFTVSLKLTNIIMWSWLWVLVPLWIVPALVLTIPIIALIVFEVCVIVMLVILSITGLTIAIKGCFNE